MGKKDKVENQGLSKKAMAKKKKKAKKAAKNRAAKKAERGAEKAEKAAKAEKKRLKKLATSQLEDAATPAARKNDAPATVSSDAAGNQPNSFTDSSNKLTKKKFNKLYERKLEEFQVDLVRMQKWIQSEGLRVALIFEGRDAAGKGGAIKRITQSLNPRICRVVALPKPTEREQSQWYYQRYVPHLPAAGEMVLFDRSWYNRAGVERVMGFCTDDQYDEFMRTCPQFERMLVSSGILLIKYWFSVSNEEQEKRFRKRINDPIRRWKISPMDLESRKHWVDYSKAKDEMFRKTDIGQSRWYVVNGDNKKRARLNVIHHLLSKIPFERLPEPELKLPKKQEDDGYERPPMEEQTFVPEIF